MTKSLRFASASRQSPWRRSIAGCAAPQSAAQRLRLRRQGRQANIGLATKALVALNANDFATAIELRRARRREQPERRRIPALLGNAYFAAGRFASAEAAYRIR